MFNALKLAREEESLSRARVTLLTQTLLVQGLSAIPWPLGVAALFYFDKDLGPLDTWRVLAWLTMLWMWCAISITLYRHLKSHHSQISEERAIRGIAFVFLTNGCLWALFDNLLWVHGNIANNALIIVIILGLSVGFAIQLTAHFGVLLCAILPPLVAEYVRMFASGSPYLAPYLVLSPIYTAWLIALGYQLNQQVAETLKTSIVNRRLAEDLRTARDSAVEQKQVADGASEAKSRFLANMSHELRTPLNAIIGFSEIIHGLVFGPEAVEKYAEYAGDIERSGRHLLALINQVLDLAKIESGKLALKHEPINLADVLTQSLNLLKLKADEKHIGLIFDNRLDGAQVDGDPTALRQIFLNIIGNAVKFTERGEVKVSGWRDRNNAIVVVDDTGPGISPEALSRIFAPFEQGDNSLGKAKEGSGLGLAIVAKLIEAHGGTREIASSVGKGTRFTVRLPVSSTKKSLAA
jgi:signal transduction histidine kinase